MVPVLTLVRIMPEERPAMPPVSVATLVVELPLLSEESKLAFRLLM